ncbi:hypothetical protein [Ruminiclostridium cellobioparum]|jgi:hypothetical protein|uniref:Uncharacterized protein n=1 Tax=Ruminiclostridium cellobioparum subsp. termitidis CT1112 TaxID=1195236 RepID=S0FIF6_RUMCE|nr:hypothetical protein [Ruminiclostridium cellobioparum]EMS69881.1 hypothetical protein CTER_4449 [Ruminiclostridium cellobioparum subsp. termitidis CT1112]
MNTLAMNVKKYISKSRNKRDKLKIGTISLEHWESIEGSGRILSARNNNKNNYNTSLYLEQSRMLFSSKLR